jgi:hypothetical protein
MNNLAESDFGSLDNDLTITTRNKDSFHQLIAWMVSRGYEHKIAKWQQVKYLQNKVS